MNTQYDNLPTNVSSKEELSCLPPQFLSNDTARPLQQTDEDGSTHKYALRPLGYSVLLICFVEVLERFATCGIQSTETNYFIGKCNPDWNPGISTVKASSYASASLGLTYSATLLAGILADGLMTDFWGIAIGTSALFIPGLALLALTTYPHLLGETFNQVGLTASILFLLPVGTGFVKSLVNVFGAKQFHPVLQSAMLESYYINFYMVLQIGALVGGILLPLVAQVNVSTAYLIPTCAMVIGILIFLLGSRRYVRVQPKRDALIKTLKLWGNTIICKPLETAKRSNGGAVDDVFVDGVKFLIAVIPITALTIPFNIILSQIFTVFIIQGDAMQPAGLFDAAMVINFNPVGALLAGCFAGSYLYPYLAMHDIHLAITHKYAIGTALCSVSMLCAIGVDYAIHSALASDKQRISVFWQIFSQFFIGAGEIFTMAAAYDAAFEIAPKEQKGFASAINLFFSCAIPNYISIALYNAFQHWFPHGNDTSTEATLEAYKASQLYNYFWVLFGISIFGVAINLFPPVKNWVERIHMQAVENNTIAGVKVSDHQHDTDSEDDSSVSESENV